MLVRLVLWLLSRTTNKQLNQIMTAYVATYWIDTNVRPGFDSVESVYKARIEALERRLKRTERQLEETVLSSVNADVPAPTRDVFTRMDQEVYEHFERTVQANALVTGTTSDIEAGFKLGVMHVLSKLRAGYVIPRSN